jgi:gliding motility-associated-like protein
MTITVNPTITPTFTQVTPICIGETLSNLPTTSTNNVVGSWSPAMNNTITTSYTFTSDTSETCAENQSMTITVNPTITPVFNSVDPICSLETLVDLPTTSLNNVVGTWWPAIDNTATTSYTFTPKEGPFCAELTTLEIVVNEISTINMILKVVLNEFNNSQSIEISVVEGKGSYEYKVNNGSWQDSNLFENLVAGKYFAAVREKIGCGAELNNWILLIDYPRFFTPNNDGINDAWQIKGLETQPETIITIFDRYGAPLSVFRAGGFGWNGIINGKKRQSNDYWFQVQYLEMENRTKTVVSHFSLLR